MSDDSDWAVVPYTLPYIWPYCLLVAYDKGLGCLASSTTETDGDKRLVVHHGVVGEDMELAQTCSVFEEPTGYHLVSFFEDDTFAAIQYPPDPNDVATKPFILDLTGEWSLYMRLAPSTYEVRYFDDLTARVTLLHVLLPTWVFDRLKAEAANLLDAARQSVGEDMEHMVEALAGLVKLIPKVGYAARHVTADDLEPSKGIAVPKGLIVNLVQHGINFKDPVRGKGFSKATDLVFFRGFYDLLRYILAFDGVKLEPLPF